MQQQINNILNQTTTKTSKIQQLLLLGLTRRQVADLVTNGNYGFVQNVYAKMNLNRLVEQTNRIIETGVFNRRFGVEFEAYNVSKSTLKSALNRAGIECDTEFYNHNNRPYWKIVNDSSLSGRDSFELVSPILQGNAGLEELRTVCRILGECGAKINKTCGTHVHFDAAGFNLETWKRIYINYARLENTIDSFMPVSRRDNNFCKSLKNIANFETKIKQASSLSQIDRTVFGSSRYYKVNPQSYSRHNTCEFRQHSGTVEFDKISNWIKLLNNLLNLSETGLLQDGTLEGLANFNDNEIVNFYKQRTNKFAA